MTPQLYGWGLVRWGCWFCYGVGSLPWGNTAKILKSQPHSTTLSEVIIPEGRELDQSLMLLSAQNEKKGGVGWGGNEW